MRRIVCQSSAPRSWARVPLRDKTYPDSQEDAMKRTKRASQPRISGPRPIAADQLVKIQGGATAIEYGLALLAPPPNK
jgi:hypothetical protein